MEWGQNIVTKLKEFAFVGKDFPTPKQTKFTGWWRTDADPTWRFYIDGSLEHTVASAVLADIVPIVYIN